MMGKSKTDYSKIDYSKQYERLSDKEISEILKRRKEYQEVAAEAAIKEAIKRGIINSEQDLFAEKYRHEPLKVSLFPRIENEESRRKMRKSLTRSLLFLGVILIVWGAWSMFNHNLAEGIGFVVAGIIWNIISFSFFKNVSKKNVNLLIVIQIIAAIYAVIKLSAYKNLPFMDIFIVVFLFGFVLYGLFYLKMLND